MAAFKAALVARNEALTESTATSEDSRKPVELDQTKVGRLSRMDAMQMQAMAAATDARRQLERKRIGAALARIEAGEYGWCLRCGERIPDARLEIDPATTLCVACASAAERTWRPRGGFVRRR